ncbi:MAG: hypothetical protein WEB29_01650 [Chloroflexota bacterium]
MSAHRDLDRLIHSFLAEGPMELPDPSYDEVRDRMEQTRQRAFIGPWRTSDMNRYLKMGLAAAAVVVIAVIASNLLPGSTAPGGEGPESVAPSQAPSEPAPSAWVGIPEGPFVVTGTDDPVQVTVNIASSGWVPLPEFDALSKDDDGLDAPETVGAALLAWAWPAGTGFNVYGDPCQWSTTIPETPATTPDEIAAAFAAQASTDATAPVDVTVGGFAGKTITLHVPMSFDLPNASREEKFADCDNDVFAFYGVEGETGEARNAQGAGQVDELWILDVNGAIVILDATYGPATPVDLVEEMRTLAESATFEAP